MIEKSTDSLSTLSNITHPASTMDTRVNMATAEEAGGQSVNNLGLQPLITVCSGWRRFSVQKHNPKAKEIRIHSRSVVEVPPLIFCFRAAAFLQDAAADVDADARLPFDNIRRDGFDWQPDPPPTAPVKNISIKPRITASTGRFYDKMNTTNPSGTLLVSVILTVQRWVNVVLMKSAQTHSNVHQKKLFNWSKWLITEWRSQIIYCRY